MRKISVKTLAAKPSCKPLPGDKSLGIEKTTHFYDIEDDDETEEGEAVEIFVTHNSRIAASNNIIAKQNFPYYDIFNHEGPAVLSAIRDLTIRLFEHLGITSLMDVDQRVAYI